MKVVNGRQMSGYTSPKMRDGLLIGVIVSESSVEPASNSI